MNRPAGRLFVRAYVCWRLQEVGRGAQSDVLLHICASYSSNMLLPVPISRPPRGASKGRAGHVGSVGVNVCQEADLWMSHCWGE